MSLRDYIANQQEAIHGAMQNALSAGLRPVDFEHHVVAVQNAVMHIGNGTNDTVLVTALRLFQNAGSSWQETLESNILTLKIDVAPKNNLYRDIVAALEQLLEFVTKAPELAPPFGRIFLLMHPHL